MASFLLPLLLLATQAFAGGANGGGTDQLPDDYSTAWFLEGMSPRAVKVCIEKDESKFPLDTAIVKTQFFKALETWKTYIVERDIYKDDADEIESEDQREIDPRIFRLTTDFRFQESCTDADLTIYLAVENKEVKEIKDSMFDPYAFVHRKTYDQKQGWGKGFLWVKGEIDGNFYWDKNKYLNLFGVFLHELGHIFGNEHIAGTIMDEKFGENLVEMEIDQDLGFWWKWYSFTMTNIDWTNELYQRFFGGSFPELGMYIPGTRAEREAFQFALGRAPKGQVRTKVRFDDFPFNGEILRGEYSVTDDDSGKTFPLSIRIASANVIGNDRHIFARLREFDPPTDHDEEIPYVSSITLSGDTQLLSVMGWMEKDGRRIPIVFEGVAGQFDMGQYAEDRKQDRLAERKYPYRMLGLDGENRHLLYGKYEWLIWGEKKKPNKIR